MGDQYIVVTRYVAPSGRAIVHAYGLYDTRRKGDTARDNILRDVGDAIVEATVCKILDTDLAV